MKTYDDRNFLGIAEGLQRNLLPAPPHRWLLAGEGSIQALASLRLALQSRWLR